MQSRSEIINEIIQIPTDKQLQTGQEDALMQFPDLPEELKYKVRFKYRELKARFPHMKNSRAMRKAGEFYKLKIEFE